MKMFTLITTAFFLSGSILPAVQAASSDLPSAVVKFGDLDITQPAGQEKLFMRLNRAAHSVCSPGGWYKRALVTPQYEACLDQTLSAALAQLNRPDFTDYVAMRTQHLVGADTRLATQ